MEGGGEGGLSEEKRSKGVWIEEICMAVVVEFFCSFVHHELTCTLTSNGS